MQHFDNIKVDIKNSENYKDLIKKYELLAQIFEIHLEPSHKKIIQEIQTINVDLVLEQVFFNKRQRGEVFEEFEEKIGEKIQEYRNQVEMVRKGFQKMELILLNLRQEFPEALSSMNYEQKFYSDLNDLKLLYQTLLNNLELHDNMKKGGQVLQQILGDYLMGKDVQKEEILKNKTMWQGMNFQNFGNQGGKSQW